jgi:hypothetical protein
MSTKSRIKITADELQRVKDAQQAIDINPAFMMVIQTAEQVVWELGKKYGVENPVLNVKTGKLLPGVGAPRELPATGEKGENHG